jgi:hypothetical protein
MTNLVRTVTEKLENSISEAARQGIIFLDYTKHQKVFVGTLTQLPDIPKVLLAELCERMLPKSKEVCLWKCSTQ